MHPQAPQQPEPSPPDPTLQALDEAIEHGTIAANAQRDIEAETAPGAPGWDEVVEDDEDADEDDDASQEIAPEPAAPAEQEAELAEPVAPDRAGRRLKLRAENEQLARERDEARSIVANAQRELEQVRQKDRHVLTQLGDISGYARNPQTGRFIYEELAEKVLDGRATPDEQQTAMEMRQWHELAGPIYREAETQVQRQYQGRWDQIGSLDGISPERMAQLNTAPDAIAAVRAMHAMALEAGRAQAAEQARQKIAKLEAENKSLRRTSLANSPQPATANGAAIPSGGGWRDRAFDANGVLTDEFEKEIRAGKWLGSDLSSS